MKIVLIQNVRPLFLGLVILFALSGCGLRYSVQGKVIDSQTEKPIAGAVVAVKYYTYSFGPPYASGYEETARVEAVSDADGEFTIPKYLLRSYNAGAYKKGYVCWDSEVIFRKDHETVVRDREDFDLGFGMIIRLDPLTGEYSKIRHACFVDQVESQCAPGGHSAFYIATTSEREICDDYHYKKGK